MPSVVAFGVEVHRPRAGGVVATLAEKSLVAPPHVDAREVVLDASDGVGEGALDDVFEKRGAGGGMAAASAAGDFLEEVFSRSQQPG